MNEVVVDASAVLRWVFDDETHREEALRLRDGLTTGWLGVSAPPTLLPEVGGVLVRAVRAGRIDAAEAELALDGLEQIGIDDPEPHAFAMMSLRLALRTGLLLGDATYVATAQRLGVPLVSGDNRQLAAAASVGVAAIALVDLPDHLS
jgi:predicted nucleic acid-binding protein